MGGRADTRGVSEVLGAILVFSILIALLALFQVTIVPDQNEEVEFKHSKEVQSQMQDLRGAIQAAGSSGGDQSTSVQLGVRYPTRLLLLNPPPVSGTIRTFETTDPSVAIEISNTEALDTETDDYWDGTTPQTFNTGGMGYRPNYNVYSSAPGTFIENSVVYNLYPDDNTVLLRSGQRLVNGRDISLVALNGSLSESQIGTVSVDTTAISASTTTIAVTNESGEHVNVSIVTQLPERVWVGKLLREQLDDNGNPPASGDDSCDDIDPGIDPNDDRFIADCEFSGNTLKLVMEQDQTYRLKLSKVGVGKGFTGTSAHYLTEIEGNSTSVSEFGRQELVVQVRDEFNNPISGEKVRFAIDQGAGGSEFLVESGSDTATIKTNEQGEATVTYAAPGSITGSEDVTVNATFKNDFSSFAAGNKEDVKLHLDVINVSGTSSTTPLFNPGEGLVVTDAEIDDGDKCGTGNNKEVCRVDVEFTFNGAPDPTEITSARYLFYNEDEQGKVGVETHEEVTLTDRPSGDSTTLVIQNPLNNNIDISFDDGESRIIEFEFEDDSGNFAEVEPGDYFVVTFILNGDTRRTYFIAPLDEVNNGGL